MNYFRLKSLAYCSIFLKSIYQTQSNISLIITILLYCYKKLCSPTTEGSLFSLNASRAMEVKEKVALLYCFEQTYFVCIFHAEIFFSSIKTCTCSLSFYTIQPTKSAFPFFTFDGDSDATNILFSFFEPQHQGDRRD